MIKYYIKHLTHYAEVTKLRKSLLFRGLCLLCRARVNVQKEVFTDSWKKGGGSFCEIERLQSQNTTFYKRFMQDRALWVSESGHTLEKGQKKLLLQ